MAGLKIRKGDRVVVLTGKDRGRTGTVSRAYPDETHTSLPLLAQIDALRSLYAGYRLHDDMLEKGLAYAQAHFQNASKTAGWDLPVPEEVLNSLGYAALGRGQGRRHVARQRAVGAARLGAEPATQVGHGDATAGVGVGVELHGPILP